MTETECMIQHHHPNPRSGQGASQAVGRELSTHTTTEEIWVGLIYPERMKNSFHYEISNYKNILPKTHRIKKSTEPCQLKKLSLKRQPCLLTISVVKNTHYIVNTFMTRHPEGYLSALEVNTELDHICKLMQANWLWLFLLHQVNIFMDH